MSRNREREAHRLLVKAYLWLEVANDLIQSSDMAEEGDDEDVKAFIRELKHFTTANRSMS